MQRTEIHKHSQVPYRIGSKSGKSKTLLLSSLNSRDDSTRVTPALGIYLDDNWKPPIEGYNGVILPKAVTRTYPYVWVDWPDRGVVEDRVIEAIVSLVNQYAVSKDSPVEIACYGGHGRTGTLAAILDVLLGGKRPGEAITRVRSIYCPGAIESRVQFEEVYYWGNEKAPTAPPAKKGGDTGETDWDKIIDEYLRHLGNL